MSIANYARELFKAKQDHKILSPNDLVLTLTPIIEDYNLPQTRNSVWVCQHWRAMPRPKPGCTDFREFGYFSWDGNELTYRIIPADQIEIQQGIEIIPLQVRRVHVPRRVPTAVNYFPNSEIVKDSNRNVFLLRGI